MIIRIAALSDAPVIATLLGELGYPSAPGAVPTRLAVMFRDPGALVVVGEEEERVVGLATAKMWPALHTDDLIAYLTSVVVSSAARRRGAGRELVRHVEAWAKGRGAARLSLVTGPGRTEAHAFYERLGYERTGYRYSLRF